MIHCELNVLVNRLTLFRGTDIIGSVSSMMDGDVLISIFADMNIGIADLTFNEIAIIQDNWNALQEIRKGRT